MKLEGYTELEKYNDLKMGLVRRFDEVAKRFEPYCTKFAVKSKIDEVNK